MARPASDNPTELELQILKILWDSSPLLVRDIREQLATIGRDVAHTSVITTLNIMVRKGYLKRKKQANAFLFEPRVSRDTTSRKILDAVVNHVFDGSTKSVLLALLDASDVDKEELKEIRQYIDRKAREQSK